MSFSSMYVGATGVVAHGQRMQVVSNNLANVSTVGYRKADALFSDLMSKNVTPGGAEYDSGSAYSSQIGMGVALGEIRNIFQEGGIENTRTVTDLAITGNGFFGVRNPGSDAGAAGATHFTRAGAFRFNNEAYLVDPGDFRLQGYAIDRATGEVATAVSDVQLPYEDIEVNGATTRVVQSDPLATSSVEFISNLSSRAGDGITNSSSPFFAMLSAYDGTLSNASTPFGSASPAFSSSIRVFDSEGNDHDMTIYFDPVGDTTISNATPGYSYWEYLIAMPASADGSDAFGTSAAGLAGLGVLTFDSDGQLVGQSAFTLADGGSGKSLSSWEQTTFASGGVPQIGFTFGENGAAVGSLESIGVDFGLTSTSSTWASGAATAAGVGVNAGALANMADRDRDVRILTSFDDGSATLFANHNGFATGFLQGTSVTRDGILTGHFTNGQNEDFFQLALYRFNSEWGLRRDGANNFLATEASGTPIAGVAEFGGRGTVNQNSLEMSNVDMAEEFANMIITQRGYQANTKVITTSDTILNTTINIKR